MREVSGNIMGEPSSFLIGDRQEVNAKVKPWAGQNIDIEGGLPEAVLSRNFSNRLGEITKCTMKLQDPDFSETKPNTIHIEPVPRESGSDVVRIPVQYDVTMGDKTQTVKTYLYTNIPFMGEGDEKEQGAYRTKIKLACSIAQSEIKALGEGAGESTQATTTIGKINTSVILTARKTLAFRVETVGEKSHVYSAGGPLKSGDYKIISLVREQGVMTDKTSEYFQPMKQGSEEEIHIQSHYTHEVKTGVKQAAEETTAEVNLAAESVASGVAEALAELEAAVGSKTQLSPTTQQARPVEAATDIAAKIEAEAKAASEATLEGSAAVTAQVGPEAPPRPEFPVTPQTPAPSLPAAELRTSAALQAPTQAPKTPPTQAALTPEERRAALLEDIRKGPKLRKAPPPVPTRAAPQAPVATPVDSTKARAALREEIRRGVKLRKTSTPAPTEEAPEFPGDSSRIRKVLRGEIRRGVKLRKTPTPPLAEAPETLPAPTEAAPEPPVESTGGRAALMDEIQKGVKLRKAVTPPAVEDKEKLAMQQILARRKFIEESEIPKAPKKPTAEEPGGGPKSPEAPIDPAIAPQKRNEDLMKAIKKGKDLRKVSTPVKASPTAKEEPIVGSLSSAKPLQRAKMKETGGEGEVMKEKMKNATDEYEKTSTSTLDLITASDAKNRLRLKKEDLEQRMTNLKQKLVDLYVLDEGQSFAQMNTENLSEAIQSDENLKKIMEQLGKEIKEFNEEVGRLSRGSKTQPKSASE